VDTVDLSPRAVLKTRWNLLRLGLVRGVRAHVGDALDFLRSRANAGARYGMAFVDHSHAYGPVHAACQALADVLAPGGFALFHDFNDPRNHDLADVDHAVHQAVVDGLDARRFTFFGIYGCLAVYRAA
jgi:SAM-dependent methyltransferase